MMRTARIPSPFDHTFLKGGPGSGNFGHQGGEGGPGNPGGSSPAGGGSDRPLPPGRQWVDSLPGLTDTEKEFRNPDGTWKPERQELHNKIKDKALAHVQPVPEGHQKEAILMMGGTASGKSSLIRGKFAEDQFVRVDADSIKEQLPEYEKGIAGSARNAAAVVHEESSYLAKSIYGTAMADGKNIVFDGTGANADKYLNMIQTLQQKGYRVSVVGSHLDVDTAKSRALARAEKTGRWVPEHFIDEAYSKIPKNFTRVMSAADNWALYDNRDAKPRLVWEGRAKQETVKDAEFLAQLPR